MCFLEYHDLDSLIEPTFYELSETIRQFRVEPHDGFETYVPLYWIKNKKTWFLHFVYTFCTEEGKQFQNTSTLPALSWVFWIETSHAKISHVPPFFITVNNMNKQSMVFIALHFPLLSKKYFWTFSCRTIHIRWTFSGEKLVIP